MENVAAVFLPIRAPMSWLDLRVISECTDLVARVLAVAGFLKAAREGNVAEGWWASERQLAWARASTSVKGPSPGLREDRAEFGLKVGEPCPGWKHVGRTS